MGKRQEFRANREGEFARVLAVNGLRMTQQRLEIVRELAAAQDHPDAETLLHRVRRRVPMLSPDTVYRTLEVLASHGLVARIPMPRANRFDPDLTPHHHFVCSRCGRVLDVGVDVLGPVPSAPAALEGIGQVDSVHLQIWGVCDACEEEGA
jgi:Fur family transcriptional regulator, peroxide stress response regulator